MSYSSGNYPEGMTAWDIPGWDERRTTAAAYYHDDRCNALFCRKLAASGRFCEEHQEEFDAEMEEILERGTR